MAVMKNKCLTFYNKDSKESTSYGHYITYFLKLEEN